MIDADLQDPPELIPDMVAAGATAPTSSTRCASAREGETAFKLATASWFYRLFAGSRRSTSRPTSGDFRLMDRRALDALLAMPERNRFLRGMTVWVGFNQTAVDVPARGPHGRARRSTRCGRMLRFSLDAITSFSNRPLQVATLLGFAFSVLAFLAIPLTVVARYADIYERGVPSMIVAVLLLGGIQLITVGIIGEYIGRIYDEVKRRPLYVVRDGSSRRRRASAETSEDRRHRGRRGGAGRRLPAHRGRPRVDVYERWPGLGGQAATIDTGGGVRLERYYHHLFTTDRHIAAPVRRGRDAGRAGVAAVERRDVRPRAPVAVHDARRPAAVQAAAAARRASGWARRCCALQRLAQRPGAVRADHGARVDRAARWAGRRGARCGGRCCAASSARARTRSRWSWIWNKLRLRRGARTRARSTSAIRAARGSRCSRRCAARSKRRAGGC